ncbi:MAG: alkaline phosphatase family protein, partial [Vulcanimicrobiaceae bacterium]
FQAMSGPSTPGNLEIIAAQAGQTQLVKHPDEAFTGNGAAGPGVPVLNDLNPLAGSPKDPLTYGIVPINPGDLPETVVQDNLTFATLPLTLEGKRIGQDTQADADSKVDLADVGRDIASLSRSGGRAIPWGWYEEGYDREPTDAANAPATGSHTSYVTHHNGPQYFGYIARNAELRGHLHGLHDLYAALDRRELPAAGGVYFVKGGFTNILGLKPADPDPAVQKHFRGDDDHPAYSDAEISEAMVAATINRIARSPYWAHSAIVITYDDSEGDYDHVPPPMRAVGPDGVEISDGPRVPLIVLSPYAKTHVISHELGDTASVPKFIDRLFDLTPLAELPDENSARIAGLETFGQPNLGPTDAETVGIGDLTSAFSRQRLTGAEPPLPPAYAEIPDAWVMVLPQTSGFGCRTLGLVPTDAYLPNRIPPDFNPRPRTDPSR